jgi:hypothetical protein
LLYAHITITIELMFDVERLETDDLEQLMTRAEAAIAHARAIQVTVVAELDKRQVATADGCRSMTDWVSSRLDLRHDIAGQLVSASRTMPEPLTAELGEGTVSFDRAITETRLHALGADPETIRDSRGLDLAGARRLAARHRRITPHQDRDAFLTQTVSIQPSLDGDGWNLWASLEGFEGTIVEKALYARAEELTDGMDMAYGLRMALALTTICQDSLYNESGLFGIGDPVITITADAGLLLATNGEAGAEIAAGPRIGPMALQELLCIGRAELNVATTDGNLLGVGKTTTSLPPRLRRAVIARDSGCVIDGCTSTDIPLPASGSLPPSQAPGDKKSITWSNDPRAAPTTRRTSPHSAGHTTTSSSKTRLHHRPRQSTRPQTPQTTPTTAGAPPRNPPGASARHRLGGIGRHPSYPDDARLCSWITTPNGGTYAWPGTRPGPSTPARCVTVRSTRQPSTC